MFRGARKGEKGNVAKPRKTHVKFQNDFILLYLALSSSAQHVIIMMSKKTKKNKLSSALLLKKCGHTSQFSELNGGNSEAKRIFYELLALHDKRLPMK